MSTPRRRPTGGLRRPQVAGRPRTARTDDPPTTEHPGTGHTGTSTAVDDRSRPDDPAAQAGPAAPVRTGVEDEPIRSRAAGSADAPDPASATGSPGSAGAAGPDAAPDAEAPEPGAGPDSADGDGTGTAAGARRRIPGLSAPRTRRGTVALAAVTALLTAAAVFFGYEWYATSHTGSAANTALTDVGTTAQVSEQVNEAVTKVYSFDFARLQQAQDDAAAVITPAFRPEFDRIFGSVRELAPQQKAVVTATIPKSAVASLDGGRATVYVFVNQVIRRQADNGTPQEGSAAARLRVDAQFVDGRWKISAMTPA